MTVWTPHPYQLDAMKRIVSTPAFGLFADPGLGKTSMTLSAFLAMKNAGRARGLLVIAPLRPVYRVWPKEIEKWDHLRGLRLVNLHAVRREDREAALDLPGDVFAANPEALSWLVPLIAARRKALPFDVLVLDESTKFKNGQTQRFKLLLEIVDRFDRRLALTGTPAPNGTENLWGQVRLLDGGERLGRFVTHFRRSYMNEERFAGLGFSKWTERPDTAERVREKISDIVLYLDAREHLKMPERVDNVIRIALTAKARKIYDQVEGDFFSQVDAGTITAANVAAAGMKLRQVASGNVYTDEGVEGVHDEKLVALSDLIEEQSGKPVLVAVAFQHEVAAIRAMLKADHGIEDAPYLGGGVSPKVGAEIEERWNRGEVPVLLAHPTSVAHGLNLQSSGGNSAVWFSLTWNLEEYDQFCRRVWRQGQKAETVFFHHLIAEETIEETIYARLGSKDKSQRALLEAFKQRSKR